MSSIIQTDILIAGAGPAGASLAAFLGQNGKMTIPISSGCRLYEVGAQLTQFL